MATRENGKSELEFWHDGRELGFYKQPTEKN